MSFPEEISVSPSNQFRVFEIFTNEIPNAPKKSYRINSYKKFDLEKVAIKLNFTPEANNAQKSLFDD